MSFELDLGLGMLGINDPGQRQTIESALPIAQKVVQHVYNNQSLFRTLSADLQLLVPAAKILLDALAANQRNQA